MEKIDIIKYKMKKVDTGYIVTVIDVPEISMFASYNYVDLIVYLNQKALMYCTHFPESDIAKIMAKSNYEFQLSGDVE